MSELTSWRCCLPDGLSFVPPQAIVPCSDSATSRKGTSAGSPTLPSTSYQRALSSSAQGELFGALQQALPPVYYFHNGAEHKELSHAADLPGSPGEPSVGQALASELGRVKGCLRWRQHTWEQVEQEGGSSALGQSSNTTDLPHHSSPVTK